MLSELQKIIINSSGKVIVKACPGSGKTYTIVHKIKKEIEEWNPLNSGIAILSFTNIACDEIKDKYRNISDGKFIQYPHFLGTVDSFIYKYIFEQFSFKFLKNKKPKIIADYSEGITNLSKNMWKYKCYSNGCDAANFYYDESLNIRDVKNKINNCNILKKPCENYKKACATNGYFTYDDILNISIYLLKNNANILNLVIKRFPYIIIDEAQDLSDSQMKLFDFLLNNGLENLILIGDPDQAIYEWRDANPKNFIKIYENEEWKKILLNENYRSSQKICNATKIFSSLTETSISVGGDKNFNVKPILLKYDKRDLHNLVDYYLAICKNNNIDLNKNNVAILCRNKNIGGLNLYSNINDLWKNDISILLSKITICKIKDDILNAYKYSEKLLYYLIISGDLIKDVDYNNIYSIISDYDWKKLILEIVSLIKIKGINLKDWGIYHENMLKNILKEFSLKVAIEVKIKTRDKLKDFKSHDISEFFDSFDSEYIMSTIHGVKGSTFESVLLIVGSNGKMTSNVLNTKDVFDEEIRNAYVAMTRPKKILVVAIPNTIKDDTLVRFPKDLWDYQEVKLRER